MYRILLIDDDQNVLNALRRELHGAYEVETFSDQYEALQRSLDASFDLAIVDYKMPGMNGIEFFRQFRRLQPDAVCVMLSGEADFDALVGTVNETHAFRFIGKPWNSAELAATIAEGLTCRKQLLENRRLAEICRKEGHWLAARDPDRIYRVLIVDDEENILSALKRELTMRDHHAEHRAGLIDDEESEFPAQHYDFHFEVVTFTSPAQALAHARQTPCDVVIADYLMPEMDGLSLLGAIRELQPEAARILLSGHADKDVLVKAINNSEIYGYLGKPWHEYTLRNIVSQAVSHQELLRENRRLAEHPANNG